MSTPHQDHDDSDIDSDDPFTSTMLPGNPAPDNQTTHSSSAAATKTSPHLEPNYYYYLYSINSNIVIRQLPSQGLSFQLWPAATTLFTLLDNHCRQLTIPGPFSALFNNQEDRPFRILELGSGTGLVGIAAAALLGANVTVTDLPHVLPNLHFNVEANAKILEVKGGEVNVAALSWGETEHMEAIGREYDVILGSDVVYHDHLYEPLIKTLRFFLLGNGEKKIVFVMAHLKRWKKESGFFKMAKKLFDVEIIHNDPPSGGSRVGVVVYRFVGKGGFGSGGTSTAPR